MEPYLKNPSCPCLRCRANAAFGPVILITVGVLALIDNVTAFGFGESWPVLLIVIGGLQILRSTASIASHRQPQPPPVPVTYAVPAEPPKAAEPQQVNHV